MIHDVFAYLIVTDTNAAIDFYVNVFGAEEKFRLTEPGGRVGHAELNFNGTTVMVADEFPEYEILSATTIGGSPVRIHLHVDDADALIRRAAEFGATVEREPTDHFYGERSGSIRDPFGHIWLIGHQIEAVEPEEMQRRYAESFEEG